MSGGIPSVEDPLSWASSLISVSIVALILAAICIWKRKHHQISCGSIDEVLSLLKETPKLWCLRMNTGWKLAGCVNSQMVWNTRVTDAAQFRCLDIYGCFNKINSPVQSVLNIISSTSQDRTWDPEVRQAGCSIEQTTDESFHKDNSEKNADVISVTSPVLTSPTARLLNSITSWFQGNTVVCQRKFVRRCWQKDDNGCSWLVEYEDTSGEWTLYLIQPLNGWLGRDVSLLTIICRPHPSRGSDRPALVSRKMTALQHHLHHLSLHPAPVPSFTPYSSKYQPHPCESNSTSDEEMVDSSAEELIYCNKTDKSEPEPNIITKFYKIVEAKKQKYEQEKRKKVGAAPVSSRQTEKAINILNHNSSASTTNNERVEDNSQLHVDNYKTEASLCELCIPNDSQTTEDFLSYYEIIESMQCKPLDDGKEEQSSVQNVSTRVNEDYENSNSPPDRQASYASDSSSDISRLKAGFRKLFTRTSEKDSKASFDSENDYVHRLTSTESDETSERVNGIPDSDRGSGGPVCPTDEIEKKRCEPLNYEEISAKASECAKGLLHAMNVVNSMDITLGHEEQASRSGGWIYSGLEREVVVLQKTSHTSDKSPVQSYMGKGVISCHPQRVFITLSSPSTRFAYDQTLKNVEVLHDLRDGLKIVHLTHEVSMLFKRESRDFCILQHERTRDNCYSVAMHSVDWPDCPSQDNVTRAKMFYSGWIIEPITQGNKIQSMVTYVTHMVLSEQASQGSLVDELASCQPVCIAALRDYILSEMAIVSKFQTLPHRSKSVSTLSLSSAATNDHGSEMSAVDKSDAFATNIAC